MKHRLSRVAPLRAGLVLGILYGILGLIFAPFFLVAAVLGASATSERAVAALGGIAFAVMAPVLYSVCGFIGGLIAAAVYNLVARWTGGLEFETQAVTPETQG